MAKAALQNIIFVKFMAENISAISFKTLEEPLLILKHLNQLISALGAEINTITALIGTDGFQTGIHFSG